MPRRALTSLAVLAVLAAGACTHDDGGAIDVGGAAVTTTSNQGTTATLATTPVSTPPSTAPALLSAVRASARQGSDRVVFEFEHTTPGYAIHYVSRPVLEDGSGKEVSVTGTAILEVRMTMASGADVSSAGYRPTYTGPRRLPGAGNEVTEVVRTGDFEGTLTWVIGLRHRVPFAARTSTSPGRVVVDLQHAQDDSSPP